MIDRVVNFTERLICLPPLTIWPAEAKAKRQPGETASVMTMPDGTEAVPVRVYGAIAAGPGVTKDLPENDAEGARLVPLSESHDQAYWDIVTAKAAKALKAGYCEFRGPAHKADKQEKELIEMQKRAALPIEIKDREQEDALKFVELEDDAETLKRWNGKEVRPKVKKAIAARIAEL